MSVRAASIVALGLIAIGSAIVFLRTFSHENTVPARAGSPKIEEVKPVAEVDAVHPAASPSPGPTQNAAPSPADDAVGRISRFADALLEKSTDNRRAQFLNLLQTLNRADAPKIYEMLRKLIKSGKDVSFELEALERRWGALDAKGAVAFLDKQPADARTKADYDQVFAGWAAADPAAARDWLNANNTHPEYDSAFLGYISGYAAKDRTGVTKTLLATLPTDDPLFGDAVSRIAKAAREDSVNALKAWFDSFPADEASLEAKKIAAYATYKQLPPEQYAANADWVAKQAAQPWRTNRLLADFANSYAANFPKNAMNWIQTTTPSPGPQPAAGIVVGVAEVVRQWEKRSMKDLQQWLETNRSSPVFDQAAHDLAIDLAGRNLPLAEYWGGQVTAPWAKPQVEKVLAAHRK